MLQSKAKPQAQLTMDDMVKLLGKEEKRELIRAACGVRAHLGQLHPDRDNIPIADSRFGEMWIIIHWKPNPELSRKEMIALSSDEKKKNFIEWLKRFKKPSFNLKLVAFIVALGAQNAVDIGRAVQRINVGERKEIRSLEKLFSEY